ncbi:aldo/keto reductase [Aphanothece hegewaldii CCALA 016]|uniref:Aldo/keto reductase n=1 Tax=Aphanothece hegewaldii CCALA 016 TaxID=2107694 RepID=A0A2T1M1L9_9CHRO|nr:aldo/keto reductase [Aphanothece hegewaldii]PSF38614.1 aldo/keto reductase [Aphanothece hegewaldii CCALA 016]
MESKKLGNTDTKISAIGLGGMPLSLSGRPSQEEAIAVIHKALDLGVTLIDTADSYCLDESDKHHNEKLIATALEKYQGDTSKIVIATKGGLMRPQGNWTRNGNPEHLRQTIRQSHKALGGEKAIDVWQYHSPDPDYLISEALAPAKEAVEQGLIRYVGVSNFSVAQIKQAQEIVEIVSVQNQYNPWNRQPENDGVLEYCEQENLTFFPWSPLGGSRRVKLLQNIPVINEIAQEKGISVYQVVLGWLSSKSPCIVPIPGASKISSIEDSIASLNVKFSPEDIQRFEQGAAQVA